MPYIFARTAMRDMHEKRRWKLPSGGGRQRNGPSPQFACVAMLQRLDPKCVMHIKRDAMIPRRLPPPFSAHLARYRTSAYWKRMEEEGKHLRMQLASSPRCGSCAPVSRMLKCQMQVVEWARIQIPQWRPRTCWVSASATVALVRWGWLRRRKARNR